MSEVPFTVFLIALVVFTILDKGLTYINLKQIEHNFPQADALKAEKNPVNRFLFAKFGLTGGTIAMFFFSITYYIAIWFGLSLLFGKNTQNTTLYVFFLIAGFTISNNIYFLLKYSRVIL